MKSSDATYLKCDYEHELSRGDVPVGGRIDVGLFGPGRFSVVLVSMNR